MCGDWKCTAALQRAMESELSILNRITWQREKGRGAKANWKNGMEDIWFGVKDPDNYYFDIEAVKQKRRVIAPYRENGKPKDWEESEEGNFRLTCPSISEPPTEEPGQGRPGRGADPLIHIIRHFPQTLALDLA